MERASSPKRRRVEARFELDGLPAERRTVARFRPPASRPFKATARPKRAFQRLGKCEVVRKKIRCRRI